MDFNSNKGNFRKYDRKFSVWAGFLEWVSQTGLAWIPFSFCQFFSSSFLLKITIAPSKTLHGHHQGQIRRDFSWIESSGFGNFCRRKESDEFS